MNMINIENLTKSYTERKLFVSVAFPLQEGENVGGIGINSCRKFMLMKIIA